MCDYSRFMAGWGWWGNDDYAQGVALSVLERLDGGTCDHTHTRNYKIKINKHARRKHTTSGTRGPKHGHGAARARSGPHPSPLTPHASPLTLGTKLSEAGYAAALKREFPLA